MKKKKIERSDSRRQKEIKKIKMVQKKVVPVPRRREQEDKNRLERERERNRVNVERADAIKKETHKKKLVTDGREKR